MRSGCVEVFEAVVAEVLQLHVTVEQLGGVVGEDDLARRARSSMIRAAR